MEIKIERPEDAPSRLSAILWGESGCGKTTLAATSPGRKLFLSFDPDGDMSIRSITGWQRVNFVPETSNDIMKAAVGTDPWGVSSMLGDFDTLIVDSLTKLSEHALRYAVTRVPSSPRFQATYEMPGMTGYGLRNSYLGTIISNLLRITAQQNKNIIFTTHERDADRNDEGVSISVRMMLGGQLPNVSSKDISEVWHMRDQNGKRMIAIRPERLRSPMKSRMFDMSSATSFEWKYNANTQTGPRLSDWWQQFESGGFTKLQLPK